MDEDLVRINVIEVSVAVPAGNGIEAGLVVLQEDVAPHRVLRMYVGQPEARAIRVAWRREPPPRPSTWDLFVSTITLLGGRVGRVVVDHVEEGRHFFAQLILERQDQPMVLTARPSDAIALALRSHGAKIFARTDVLDAAGEIDEAARIDSEIDAVLAKAHADGLPEDTWTIPSDDPLPEDEPPPEASPEPAPLAGSGGPPEAPDPVAADPPPESAPADPSPESAPADPSPEPAPADPPPAESMPPSGPVDPPPARPDE